LGFTVELQVERKTDPKQVPVPATL